MKTIAYNNKKLRITGAFAASFYILFHGRSINLVKAFTSPGFYVALAISFAISFLLTYTVHIITVWLDKRSPWRSEPVKRSLLQFLLGVILPATADLMLISIYFHTLEQNIIDNGFLLIDFPVIVAFIVFMNLYYVIHYILLTEPKPTIEYIGEIDQNSENIETKTLTIDHSRQYLQFDIRQEILYFYRFRKHVKLFAVNGEEYPVKETLGSLAQQFKDCSFIQINRSVVLNFSIVEDYRPGLKRNTLELIFNNKYSNLLEDQHQDQFVVTKEHISKVTDFFNIN
ncbi:LytTR family DNA-binding domain-containing protein [Chryseobacterium viscerum]|uniref:LytTR family transcriptional regulator n=1 Tax=Chryseobacterium viscerum TaxID=1037377 RepID=A0A316WUJ9_9FLAO|nr:LytTR family DNA-binding domain-containing protein [Chryseobacterium viscerum]PWN64126.1 LytTR family transcriptional regulator [Chryseobacterium viscerum]